MNIDQIPADLIPLIAQYLTPREIKNFSITSKRYNINVCQNKTFLLLLISRDITSHPDRINKLRHKSLQELQQLYREAYYIDLIKLAENGYEQLLETNLNKIMPLSFITISNVIGGIIKGEHFDMLQLYIDRFKGDNIDFDLYFRLASGVYDRKNVIVWLVKLILTDADYDIYKENISNYLNEAIVCAVEYGEYDLVFWLYQEYPNIIWDWCLMMLYAISSHNLDIFKLICSLAKNYKFNWDGLKAEAEYHESTSILDWIESNQLA